MAYVVNRRERYVSYSNLEVDERVPQLLNVGYYRGGSRAWGGEGATFGGYLFLTNRGTGSLVVAFAFSLQNFVKLVGTYK